MTRVISKKIVRDIIEWDVVNWGKLVEQWEPYLNTGKQLTCLEIGGRRGGLSLLAALHGNKVVCSDLDGPEPRAVELHKAYQVDHLVQYQKINALEIPYNDHFDIVMLKSVLPSIGCFGGLQAINEAIAQIEKSLKRGGILLFAENLRGTRIHQFLRRRFTSWGSRVYYFEDDEIRDLLSNYTMAQYSKKGFLGALGRSEFQRSVLGKIDCYFDKIIPQESKYLVLGVAIK